jgi:DNA polymerase-1
VAELILKQRQASKRAEFLRSWLGYASEGGIIHASFNSGSVKTGRLSSSGPNLQQVTKKLRPAFIPRDGYVLADFDYSQIELRVAAFISRSEPMIEAFKEGADLHRRFASVINNSGEEDVTADQRQQAKAGNFGLLYEMGAFGFQQYAETAYGVILTIEEAVRIHTAFFTMWKGMKDWHNRAKASAHRDGFITSPLGRVRRLPNIWDGSDRMVAGAERQAINSPVQSMASDLLQMAMASMQGLLHESVHLPKINGAYPVATVHDSIVVELEQKNWEAIAEQVAERMQSLDEVLAKFGVDFDVPLLADYSVGTRWSLSDVSKPETPVLETVSASAGAIEFDELL